MKSGHAVAVALRGSVEEPRAVARYIVQMNDPANPGTRQPYHNRMFRTEEDEAEIARRVAAVRQRATVSVTSLVNDMRRTQPSTVTNRETLDSLRAVLVVGSLVDPATLGSPHMRAHASEGRLFRTVLEEALGAFEITCDVVVEKVLEKQATGTLRRSSREIGQMLTAIGASLGRPWRADEKAAAIAAWLALSLRID